MAPRSFGKYEVLARLATGGAASIFLARQPGAAGFRKLVALKTLLPERASDEDFVAMFLDEARLAARLNHPNCVQIYDLGRVRGVYYISMEYIFGETLWNLLTTVTKVKVALPPSSVAHIIAASCDGLHHAHELKDLKGKAFNLVHRDVSPQNIMITFEGQTKVLDFGIAKAETGRAPTMAGIVKGKFSYMSPEQITGGQVDRRSDIYSLGIVMFECLASRRLYRGDSPEEIAKLILEHRAPRLRDVVPDIPEPLDEICARALSRHPSKRFQSAQEMGEAIRNHLDDVRYNQSSSSLAKLLKERFGKAIEERRQVFEGALADDYDDKRLLDLLDARAVRDVDLFPEESEQTSAEDFMETGAVLGPKLGGAPEIAPTRNEGLSSSRRQGPGWRVELDTAPSSDVEPISVGSRAGYLSQPPQESDATRIDPSDDPEGATIAGLIEPNDDMSTTAGVEAVDRTQLDAGTVDAVPLVQPAPGFDPDATEDGSDAHTQSDVDDAAILGPFDDRTPLDALAEEDLRPPSFGGAAAELEARLAEMEGMTAGDTIDASDPISLVPPTDTAITHTPRPGRAPSVGRAPDPAEPADTAAAIAVVAARAEVDPDLDPTPPPQPRVDATTGSTPSPRPAPVKGGARFGLPAVLAALVFGVSVGIVIGMLLARVVFDMTPVQVGSGRVVELDE